MNLGRDGTAGGSPRSQLGSLGIALQQLRRYDEAITAHQRAIAMYRETSDRHRESTALNNLGLTLQAVGRHSGAISAHQGRRRHLPADDAEGEGAKQANLERAFAARGT